MRCASTYVSGSPQHRTPGLSTRTKRGAKTQGGTLRTRFAVVKTPRCRAYPYFTADTYTRAPYAYPSGALRRVRYDDRPPMSRASMRRQSRPAKTKAAPRERNAPTAEVRPTPRCACTRRRKRYASDRHREANRSHPPSRAKERHEKGGHGRAYPKTREDGPHLFAAPSLFGGEQRVTHPRQARCRKFGDGRQDQDRLQGWLVSTFLKPPPHRRPVPPPGESVHAISKRVHANDKSTGRNRSRACDFKTCARAAYVRAAYVWATSAIAPRSPALGALRYPQ